MQRSHDREPDAGGWLVACLCADWCGTCREYRAAFDAVARQRPGWRFVWVDIEDESDALAEFDLDIEDFPTVLVAHGTEPRFLGTLLPHAGTLARTLQAAEQSGLNTAAPDDAPGLVARVREIGRAVG